MKPQERRDDGREILSDSVDAGDESVVGAGGVENVMEPLLAPDVLFPPEQGAGNRFRSGENRFPTFWMFSFVDV